MTNFSAKAQILIQAPVAKVWQALTDPAMIKQYLFGTEVVSDWQVGSSLTYKGVWEGKPYEDKGIILKLEPEKLLETSYWSAFSGTADSPENYQIVSYALQPQGAATELTITQTNAASAEAAKHSEQNWQSVLEKLKILLEV
jgi:uncharacterized protein YndB with AHSA1/START domain